MLLDEQRVGHADDKKIGLICNGNEWPTMFQDGKRQATLVFNLKGTYIHTGTFRTHAYIQGVLSYDPFPTTAFSFNKL